MAEKKKYNSILISGRKDETLTYSRYIKDEESGESVKETLDKKVNVSDKLETQQIKDGAITNEKLAADSVGNGNIQDGSVSNEKLEDGSVTNEKLAVNSITKDKLKDNTIGVEKLDPELRQTINAATGLPENLVETIQNVDDTLKDHQSQLDDKQSQIDDKQQQITANDEDISLLQTRSTQMEETIKGIAATGGASQATAVTYNNEKSKLTAVNIQSAVDEVVDKASIKDEKGNVQDTPFRVIENEEFIMAVVDSEDRYLFGIYRATGKPCYPLNDMYHISHSEEFLWVILDAANHPLLGIQQDGTCWAAKAQWLDDIKAIKEELSSIDETLKTFQPKEDGKGLINMEIAYSFFYISNDEYIIALVDAKDRILAGIKYDGQPYFPNHEMYSVIANEEWLYAIIDAEKKVLGGFRADDGHMIVGGVDISTFIANVIIDVADIKKRIAHLSTIENDEYLSVETDADGKVIGYVAPDGSHYLYKVKSETIPTEFSHIEDPEGRTEITTDADKRVLSYRSPDGIKNELTGFNSSRYYLNNEERKWIEEKDVIPIVKNTNGDIPLNIIDGVTDHNTINLLVATEIQKTFNDGVNSFTPPNAGYELSNRIECKAGDWFTRTGTATGMIIVTDANDKNGMRLFASDGSTLGSTFQIPSNLTDVRYVRMAVDATSAKVGEVAICRGKNAFIGEQKGDFLTVGKLRISSSNMSKDLKYLKTSNGDYYELYIDESDFSVKARKIDPTVITELPDDFPVFQYHGDFSKYFKSYVTMSSGYLIERNQNGVTNFLKLAANHYGYAEFRKETTPRGELRYVAMFPYTSYNGLKGEKGLTIYNKDFDVIDTNVKVDADPDAHDFVYIDDNHLIVFCYSEAKSITINHNTESLTKKSYSLLIEEIKKINGKWTVIASFNGYDYPRLLTDGIHEKSSYIATHWNTIQLDYDGNLIVNMRDMNCFWKIRRTVDSEGNVIIGSKIKDYNEAVIGRVGGIYNSAYIDSKRVLEEGFRFTDEPSSLTDISSDEIPLWKFYHEHDVTYWGMKEINGKEYPTYILFDNNMWTGETPTSNYCDLNPRNNYKNNPSGNDDTHFVSSKSDGGAYDSKMVSRIVQLSIDWDNHIIKDYKVYEIPKKYSHTRSSVQMFDEGILFISWADQSSCGLFDFNDKQTIIEDKLYKNGKMLFSSTHSSYRVHGYK